MVNRQVRDKYRAAGKTVAPVRDTINDHGAPAYTRTPEEDLIKFLMVGSTDNTFYVGKEDNINRALALFADSSISTELKAKACIYAREYGYNRELPILMLAQISKESPDMFKRIQSRVLKNPHDWDAFIDICRSGAIRNGIGRSIKTSMNGYLASIPEYHALKYPSAVMDMINIARPNPTGKPVVNFMKSKDKKNWKDGVGVDSLVAYERAKDLGEAIRTKRIPEIFYTNIAWMIRNYRLPYEAMTSVIGPSQECWKALLDTAPYFNMIRNMNNFVKYGAITPQNIEEVCNKITDKEAIRKSMMYPFRFYQAANAFNVHDTLTQRIKLALIDAIDVSLVNMPSLPGKTMIMTDCSGSMSGPVNSDRTDISCVEVAGIFSAVLHKKSSASTVLLPFDTELRADVLNGVIHSKNVFEAAQAYTARGGTSMAVPMVYMIERRVKVDNIIGFTDNMDWCSMNRAWNDNLLFADALLRYKKTVNPNVKTYLITLMGYQGYPVPPEMKDVTFIYGWSDKIVELIGKDMNEQIEKVRNLEI